MEDDDPDPTSMVAEYIQQVFIAEVNGWLLGIWECLVRVFAEATGCLSCWLVVASDTSIDQSNVVIVIVV